LAAVNDLSFRVHHARLPMADLNRSIAFYTRLLGMKVKERMPAKPVKWKSV
jgi:catechol 2,3-dioxygenase-like lactoylglutathione lyase family enzyme